VRAAVAERLGDVTEVAPGQRVAGGMDAQAAVAYLTGEVGMDTASATQLADYLLLGKAALGAMPTQQTLVAERFFDEGGGMQLVLHAPFGSRLNRAWGLALRKRFCRQFNFELQAAAMEDAIVLSLGPTHSFPLGDVFRYLNAETVRDVLVQALLDAPMFEARWRWNATRALAVLRFRGGKKTPPQLQRMQAGDLLALIFPDQQACLENIQGDREIPDHPLVGQTIRDCLEEATDLAGLQALLRAIAAGEKTLIARDVTEPSPFAQQVLNARPYAFLDDAPLEERRTQAVASRRWLDADTADDLGALDAAAVLRVRGEAWPQARNADELHDALMLLGFVTEAEGAAGDAAPGSAATAAEAAILPLPLPDVEVPSVETAPAHGWTDLLAALIADDRATRLVTPQGARLWVAAERLPELLAVYPAAQLAPAIRPPADAIPTVEREAALRELVRNRLEGQGPLTTGELAQAMGLPERDVQGAMLQLEGEGFVLRGHFTPGRRNADGAATEEWCERRLLARIHRYTLNRLRQEIQPVTPVQYLRFLTVWQRVAPGSQGEGADSLDGILTQLEGFETPAAAWEDALLPARLNHYEPGLLDGLCLSGRAVWLRLTPPGAGRQGRLWGPVRATPITLVQRQALAQWQRLRPAAPSARTLSAAAEAVQTCLQGQGASFFADLQAATGLLQTQLEAALAELVAWGRISSDSFAGLRALLQPQSKRPAISRRLSGPGVGMDRAGRWSLLGPLPATEPAPPAAPTEPDVDAAARTLLRRYGVVFRRVLERETLMPPWRDLLRVYRRLEARGELRGGRFVEGMAGEQYALPEAVGMLRNQRRKDAAGELVCVSGADPLNLVGIMTPGERLPALTGNRLLLRDGQPIAMREGRNMRFLVQLDAEQQALAERSLSTKPARAAWRQRLGHAG
jgi:ATP-dependent Lhr-like helicase